MRTTIVIGITCYTYAPEEASNVRCFWIEDPETSAAAFCYLVLQTELHGARLSIIHASIISTSIETAVADIRRYLRLLTETEPGISEWGVWERRHNSLQYRQEALWYGDLSDRPRKFCEI